MSDLDAENRARAQALGAYLKSLRSGMDMTLRDAEEATNREVSNAYLSQLENGKIAKPSPNVLHTLATLYGVSYAKLMERAGYISPADTTEHEQRVHGRSSRALKHGRAATFAVENLTSEEEAELLKYLAWYRSKRGGS